MRHPQAERLFDVLFDPEDHVCVTMSFKGTQVSPPASRYSSNYEFFAINPILGEGDLAPTRSFHRGDIPRRADCNVTKLRNLVFEADKGSKEYQKKKINELAVELGLPVSAVVFSGNKSFHIHISRETPFEDVSSYTHAWERIHKWLELNGLLCDKATKNISRLTRYPGNIRYDTKKEQALEFVGERIADDVFLKFLEACPEVPRVGVSDTTTFDGAIGHYMTLFGYNPSNYGGSRHVNIWSVGKNLVEGGAPPEVVDFLIRKLNESWDGEQLNETQISERLQSIHRG